MTQNASFQQLAAKTLGKRGDLSERNKGFKEENRDFREIEPPNQTPLAIQHLKQSGRLQKRDRAVKVATYFLSRKPNKF